MMRLYHSRLLTLSVYSIFRGIIFLFLLLISVPEVRFRIQSNFKGKVIEHVSKYTGLERVLLDVTISTQDVVPTERCVREDHRQQKTIVIIPYRNRTQNLKLFISPLHQHIMNQV